MNYEIQFSSAILSHRLSWGLRFKVAEITELTKDGANTEAKQSWAGQKGKNDDYLIYFLTANFKLFMKLLSDCIILLQFHWHITYAKNWFLFLKIVT